MPTPCREIDYLSDHVAVGPVSINLGILKILPVRRKPQTSKTELHCAPRWSPREPWHLEIEVERLLAHPSKAKCRELPTAATCVQVLVDGQHIGATAKAADLASSCSEVKQVEMWTGKGYGSKTVEVDQLTRSLMSSPDARTGRAAI